MGIAARMMRGGVSAGMAKSINGDINSSVSAAGTTQGTATALMASINSVTTVAASSGVILPSCDIGDDVWVYNGTVTNALTVYPDSGSTINQVAANTGISLPPYTGALFKRITSTAWLALMSR